MPTVNWNLRQWDRDHHWEQAGSEWSVAWGTDNMQWYGSILPRLQRYLPARCIVEIAPGFGRWTRFLAQYCERLDGVDLSPSCVEHCRERFSGLDSMTFHVNDGQSLSMIDDRSVDLVFSFDSLVHVESNVMRSYVQELARILDTDGIAFIHHSNLGAYRGYFRLVKAVKSIAGGKNGTADVDAGPEQRNTGAASGKSGLYRLLERVRPMLGIDSDRSRALSMSADKLHRYATESGLRCCSQETINWGTRRMIDCISVISRQGSGWSSVPRLENPYFMREASMLRRLADCYSR
jgi:SAM-dependent methyltransferase